MKEILVHCTFAIGKRIEECAINYTLEYNMRIYKINLDSPPL
jgi:hypothetical protein